MNLVIDGMAEGFIITDGFGDPGVEPPPTPPADQLEDTVLGPTTGGMWDSTEPLEGLGFDDV